MDELDLGRVGVRSESDRLCTNGARELIYRAHERRLTGPSLNPSKDFGGMKIASRVGRHSSEEKAIRTATLPNAIASVLVFRESLAFLSDAQ